MEANTTCPNGTCFVLDTAVWAGAIAWAELLGQKITSGDSLLEACRAAAVYGGAAGRVMADVLSPVLDPDARTARLCLSRRMQDQLTEHLTAQGLDRLHAAELTVLAAAICEASGGSADLDGGMSAQSWVPASLLWQGWVGPEDIALLSTAEAAIGFGGGPVVLVTGDTGLRRAARAAAHRGVAVMMTTDYAPTARRTAHV